MPYLRIINWKKTTRAAPIYCIINHRSYTQGLWFRLQARGISPGFPLNSGCAPNTHYEGKQKVFGLQLSWSIRWNACSHQFLSHSFRSLVTNTELHMLSPLFMPNLTCHTTPSILKPPPLADTVSWKTLDSTFSPSDQIYYRLVSGEQSSFLSFHWSQLPQAPYIPWPTHKFLAHAVSTVPDLPSPDLIPAFPLLCSGHKHHSENLSCLTPSVTSSFQLASHYTAQS